MRYYGRPGSVACVLLAAVFFCGLLLPAAIGAQDTPPPQFSFGCGSDVTPDEAVRYLELLKLPTPQISPNLSPAPYCVPIAGHIVRRTNGTGGMPLTQFTQSIIDANVAFANTGIVFYALGVDYIDSDFYYSGITTQADIDALRSLNKVVDAINMYYTPTLPGLCGISSFTFSTYQGIVMNNSCTGVPSNASTVPHEIGHYFNLFHTHEPAFGLEYVDGTNCTGAGDQLCDTPADPNLYGLVNTGCVYTGGATDPHGDPYVPDTHQLMSYSRSTCQDVFSPLSEAKALSTLLTLRPSLLSRGCTPVTPCTISDATPPKGFVDETLDIVLVGTYFAQFTNVNMGSEVTVNSVDTLSTSDSLAVNLTVTAGATPGPRDIIVTNAFDPDTLVAGFNVLDTPRHYVSPSGSAHYPYALPATAAPTMAAAIAAAGSGDSVLVDTTTVINPSFIVSKPLIMSGAWTNGFTSRDPASKKTTLMLSGNLVLSNSTPIVFDGFSFFGGHGSSGGSPISGRYGGALFALNVGLTVTDCEFLANNANNISGFGGGGAVYAKDGTVAITGSDFSGNMATRGGAIYLYQSTGTISGNTIENNTIVFDGASPEGAGIAIENCAGVTLSDNVIHSNTGAMNGGGVWVKNSTDVSIGGGDVSYHTVTNDGGGIYSTGSTVTLDGTRVSHNTSAFFGGALVATGTSTVSADECEFSWNSAALGGAVSASAGSAALRHNLFVGNTAASTGGAAYMAGLASGEVTGNTVDRNNGGGGAGGFLIASSPIPVFDNIVTNSTGTGLFCGGTPPTMSYNLVWNSSAGDYSGCAAGTGSLSSDPLYADTAAVDYRLAVHSPAIDAGDPTSLTYDDPDGSRGDMGRYGSHAFVMDQPSYPKNPATQIAASQLTISWDRNPEGDVDYYAVYCDTVSGFVPSPATFVAAAPDTSLTIPAPNDTTYYRVSAVDTSGYAGGFSAEVLSVPSTATAVGNPAPLRTRLSQNVPNPFNPTTTIEFSLAAPGRVDLVIYDVGGRRVRSLVDGTRGANTYKVVWDGTNDQGARVASGIYFYRLTAGSFNDTRKMVLLK